jgi:glucokinase
MPQRPADVTAAWSANADPAAVEAIEFFVTYLGRVAGDLALIFMARGGVFLAGGIVQKIIPALNHPRFREAFRGQGAAQTILARAIPTFVITHPLAALSGLAAYARTPVRFGVSHQRPTLEGIGKLPSTRYRAA